jgi:hypothetical protein
MERNSFKQINWQDGMKLNKNHFVLSDNFHLEQQIITRGLHTNENNFGILPSSNKTKPSFEISLAIDDDYVIISKFKISALMLNGMYVNVDNEEIAGNNIDHEALNLKFKYSDFNEKFFALVLKSNSFKGIEFGKFESEDFPLKRPLILPLFEFIIAPVNKLKESFFSDNFFIIAKFEIENRQLFIDKKYIPPVTSMVAYKMLVDFHAIVLNSFNMIENYLSEISKKYSKQRSDNYAETLVLISNSLILHLSLIKFEIKHKLLQEPPIELIIRIKSFANILSKMLETRTLIGKDGFMNEVVKILGISKNEFDELIKMIVNLEYRHHNISESIFLADRFLSTVLNIFKILSEGENKQKNKHIDITIKK